MDFTLSKEHEMARALFREFAEKEVKPLAIEVDETEVFPRIRRTGLRYFNICYVRRRIS